MKLNVFLSARVTQTVSKMSVGKTDTTLLHKAVGHL